MPLDSWLEGFNSSIVSLGQTGTGKTRLLFGPSSSATSPHASCVLAWVLRNAFACLEGAAEGEGMRGRIAISCVDVRGNEMHDLLRAGSVLEAAHSAAGKVPPPPRTNQQQQLQQQQCGSGAPLFVEVRDIQEAQQVLHAARAMSANWAAEGRGGSTGGRASSAAYAGQPEGGSMPASGLGNNEAALPPKQPELVSQPGRAHTLVRLLLRQGGGGGGSGGHGSRGVRLGSLGPGQSAGTESCLSILDMVRLSRECLKSMLHMSTLHAVGRCRHRWSELLEHSVREIWGIGDVMGYSFL